LITSDIAENCLTGDDLLTRIYTKLGGVTDRFAVPLLLRLCYRDKARSAEDIRRVLEWDFDRIILAHGEVLESGGKAALLESYRWLLGQAA
jgi:phage FluMu protein gp41